jgi:uncharacterized protein YjbJ (UPF0337 family)
MFGLDPRPMSSSMAAAGRPSHPSTELDCGGGAVESGPQSRSPPSTGRTEKNSPSWRGVATSSLVTFLSRPAVTHGSTPFTIPKDRKGGLKTRCLSSFLSLNEDKSQNHVDKDHGEKPCQEDHVEKTMSIKAMSIRAMSIRAMPNRSDASAKKAEGKLAAAYGDLTGDAGHQVKGNAKQIQASAMDAAGDLKPGAQSVAHKVAGSADPLAADLSSTARRHFLCAPGGSTPSIRSISPISE